MVEFYNLISDIELEEQLKESFRTRYLDQKFLYLQEGADLFYQERKSDLLYGAYKIDSNVLQNLDIRRIFSKDEFKKNIFVSLGCGDSHIEKFIFGSLKDFGNNFEYFGVDSSSSMLNMSVRNISNMNFDTNLICADFFSRDFKTEIVRLSSGDHNRIFAMFGNVFGNLNPTKIISALNNILRSGDKLWIDVRLKKGDTVGDDLKLFNKYCEYLKSKEQLAFFNNTLLKLGVPRENFSLYIATFNDPVLGSVRFDFRVSFNKKTRVNIFGDDFIILPDEDMKIVHIYSYDYYKLIEFLKEHGFELKSMSRDNGRGHFIFEKV